MNRKAGHENAALRRRVGTDGVANTQACSGRSTRRALLLAAAAWPLTMSIETAWAQPKPAPVLIGWLETGSRKTSEHRLAAFKENFASLGWKEGVDYRLEERWADGRTTLMPQLASDLAALNPAIIVAAPSNAVAAAAKAAPKTPIVQANGDPLASKLVTNLARPGGMITGVSNVTTETVEKYLELLLVAAPKLRRVGYLLDPLSGTSKVAMPAVQRSTARYRVEARFAEATVPEDIEPAIVHLAKEGAQGLILMPNSWFIAERQRIVKLALTHRLPLAASQLEFAEEGALLSYGVDRTALYRRAAFYVDRILKGAKPGDLPIELPTKFELIVNGKNAKALGLTITPELRLRADRVIE